MIEEHRKLLEMIEFSKATDSVTESDLLKKSLCALEAYDALEAALRNRHKKLTDAIRSMMDRASKEKIVPVILDPKAEPKAYMVSAERAFGVHVHEGEGIIEAVKRARDGEIVPVFLQGINEAAAYMVPVTEAKECPF